MFDNNKTKCYYNFIKVKGDIIMKLLDLQKKSPVVKPTWASLISMSCSDDEIKYFLNLCFDVYSISSSFFR